MLYVVRCYHLTVGAFNAAPACSRQAFGVVNVFENSSTKISSLAIFDIHFISTIK